MKFLNFLRGETFARGIHPPQNKHTAHTPIRRLPFAPHLIVPLSQHIGKTPRPTVHVGQEVVRGQPIAKGEDWLSVPHHAPATGVVEAIELRPTARGPWTESIVIRPHAGATQEDLWGSPRNTDAMDAAEILQAVWDSGLVGLGGAAFPTHAKLTVPKQAKVHTLVVNGCECEPYLTCDHRVMLEKAPELIRGMQLAMRATGAVRGIVGVEDNKPDAVATIQAAIDATKADNLFVEAVPTKYPQGSEKMLLMALFGVEITSGALPVSLGMVMNNVGTLAALGQLLPAGQGLTERVVTIAGPGVSRPGDYRVPLGTPISFVLEWAGAQTHLDKGSPSACQLVLGGPMMGQSVASLETPVTKGVSGILVFRPEDMADRDGRRTFPCIKCGECVESCPMGLNPSALGMLAAKREYDLMGQRYHLGDCFECGCCTYVCPSNIPLVQQFRIAKQVLREKGECLMSTTVEIRSAPHIKAPRTVEQIMRNVVGSLLPVCAFFVYQYGISALASLLTVTVACLLTERFFEKTGTQSGSLADWSAIITGLLLALTLPPGYPLWMGFVAGVVAIALGKALFGGIGFNVFNPALVGRAFVQAAFPVAIASYTPSFLPGRFMDFIPSSLAWPMMMPPDTAAWLLNMPIDGLSGATPLAKWKFDGVMVLPQDLLSSLAGHMAVGPSPLLILACGAYLALRRFMDWRIPAAILGSAGVTAWVLYGLDPVRYPNPFFMMFSGGLMLGAIYMATDMATSPVTPRGMWVYGALIGLLTVVIRYYSGLPEGVMYAILIGNAATPLIERITQPTPFGKSGLLRPKRGASYPLHPEYISREEANAVTPKKRLLKNKPKS